MTEETKPRHKRGKIIAGILLAVLLLAGGGFYWYVSNYYRAEDVALEVLSAGDNIEVRDDLTILSPSYPTDTAIIFYPGAKVEAAAYLPLLDQLRQTGLTCILVEMPFHLAIFGVNAAEDVMAQFPDISHWYIAGHSMGGAMASQFAADHPDEVDGLILLGAYLYGDYPPQKTLTIYGSLNQSVEDEGKADQDPGQKNDRKQEQPLVVFIVVLLTGKQLVRIIDIIEIQIQGRCCRVLEMGSILPFFAFDCVAIDGAPVVARYLAGGVLIHQRRFHDVVPALCDVSFPFPADAVGHLFVERHRDGIAADQDGEYDCPFEPVDRIVGKHRDESLLDTQFQHLPRHLLCSSYDIWRRSARQNDTFDDAL